MTPRKKRKRRTYEREPQLPQAVQQRYALVLAVLNGTLQMAEGARQAGLSRNRFQTLVHRAQKAMITSLKPGPPGRPAKPEREATLEKEVQQLTRQNEKLQGRVETVDHLLGVASQLVRGPLEMQARPRSSKTKTASTSKPDDDVDALRERLTAARELRALGLTAPLAAALADSSPATLRRWAARERSGLPLRRRRGPRKSPPLTGPRRRQLEDCVREMHGLIGCDALRHAVPGASRRQAHEVKQATLRQLERERKRETVRIKVAAPGILRGLDGMHLRGREGVRWTLVAADGCVPYRTTLCVTPRYDSAAVAALLDRDLGEHGAPLVYRLDRASTHRTDEEHAVLVRHGVLLMHGPPRLPRFYGQLERQNREHRAWLGELDDVSVNAFPSMCKRMTEALNCAWPRRTLGWRTAEAAWKGRPLLDIDRAKLHESVLQRTDRLRQLEAFRDVPPDTVERHAIEQELINRGLLSRVPGGWC